MLDDDRNQLAVSYAVVRADLHTARQWAKWFAAERDYLRSEVAKDYLAIAAKQQRDNARIAELEAAHDAARDIARSNSHALDAAQAHIAELRALVADLADPDPCNLDHHGYCQAHFWLTEGRCPHARAADLLAEDA